MNDSGDENGGRLGDILPCHGVLCGRSVAKTQAQSEDGSLSVIVARNRQPIAPVPLERHRPRRPLRLRGGDSSVRVRVRVRIKKRHLWHLHILVHAYLLMPLLPRYTAP